MDINRFKRIINKHSDKIKVVSFDVFDTLLIRLVPSERVSRLSAQNLHRLLSEKGIDDLTESKIIQSRDAYIKQQKHVSLFREKEWLLSDWLNSLAKENEMDSSLLTKLGREAELGAEEESLRLAEIACEAVDYIKERGKTAIAVSDMWLDQGWLAELLERFGLNFDGVFTSGSLGGSKKNKAMFRKIEAIYKMPGSVFLHIGNKLRADFICPGLSGWKALRAPWRYSLIRMNLPPKLRVGYMRRRSFEDIIQALEVSKSPMNKGPYFKIGYNYLAPLLIIFSIVSWRKFLNDSVDVAFYIARDGYLLKQVYDMISDLLPGSCPRKYIRLSRRVIALAHPGDLLQNASPLPGKMGRKTVGDWLSNFTIRLELREKILSLAGLTVCNLFDIKARKRIKLACNQLMPLILAEQKKDRDLIRDYILQQTDNERLEKIGVLDSGWSCFTQETLSGIFPEWKLISGIYFGISLEGTDPNSRSKKYGLLRDDFRKCLYHNPLETTAGVIRVWETLLHERTGSTVGFDRLSDNNVIPVMDEKYQLLRGERLALESLNAGLRKGVMIRRKGVGLIMLLSEYYNDCDFEKAATLVASKISSCPDKEIAGAIFRLIQFGFEEGVEKGRRSSLGLKGLKDGVAWYPGILASAGLGWASPLIKYVSKVMYKSRVGNIFTF